MSESMWQWDSKGGRRNKKGWGQSIVKWWVADWEQISVKGRESICFKGWKSEIGDYLALLWYTNSRI